MRLGDEMSLRIETTNINPRVLVWARESAGMELKEAAEELNLEPFNESIQILRSFETGESVPGKEILNEMSKVYHRSLLSFYNSEPPPKGERGIDYRGNSADHSNRDNGRMDALIRTMRVRQSIVSITVEDLGDPKVTFVNSHSTESSVSEVGKHIRTLTEVDGMTESDTFGYLRSRLESAGVFVILEDRLLGEEAPMGPDLYRLATIADPQAPFIMLNESLAPKELIEGLIHGATHLALGQSGFCTYATSDVEKFCREVTTEVFRNIDIPNTLLTTKSFGDMKRYKEGDLLINAVRRARESGDLSWTRAGTVLNVHPLEAPYIIS